MPRARRLALRFFGMGRQGNRKGLATGMVQGLHPAATGAQTVAMEGVQVHQRAQRGMRAEGAAG